MTDSTPQFGTAEYPSAPGTDTCKSCKQAITGRYYRINGSLACERCTEQVKTQIPKDSHSAFVRGLAFGIGGAILGLILYSGFGILTGIVIGYISLAVGFIVGKAIRFGSGGIGGRRYQIAAGLLTYAAVSMAAVPIGISMAIKDKKIEPPARVQQSPSAPAQSGAISARPIRGEFWRKWNRWVFFNANGPETTDGRGSRARRTRHSRSGVPFPRATGSVPWGHRACHPVRGDSHRGAADRGAQTGHHGAVYCRRLHAASACDLMISILTD